MVKGKVKKIETLEDGSVKLSVSVKQEEIYQAIPLNQQEVVINLGAVKQKDFSVVIQLLEEIKKIVLEDNKEVIEIKEKSSGNIVAKENSNEPYCKA